VDPRICTRREARSIHYGLDGRYTALVGWRFCKPPTLANNESHERQHIIDLPAKRVATQASRKADLGTVGNGTLRRRGTSDSIFLRNVEAPPGFEPGVEVLQGHPRCFRAARELALFRPELVDIQ